MKTKLAFLLFALLLTVVPVSAQDSTDEATAEVTVTATPAATEVATAEATTAPTDEATAESTLAATTEATVEATAESTLVPTAEVTAAPTTAAIAAPVLDNPDGVQVVSGQYAYTDQGTPDYGSQPEFVMLDLSRAATRDRDTTLLDTDTYSNLASTQYTGSLTSDHGASPWTYKLNLPNAPDGTLTDVNHDGKTDTGVRIYAVIFAYNVIGDGRIQPQDTYAIFARSYLNSAETRSYDEINGGKLIVYAPDGKQSFPSGFGADGLLFTDDDPIAPLQAGYTVVDLDTKPFTFDRSTTASLDLHETELLSSSDFSKQTYTQAFQSLVALMRKEYSYTELYKLDWDALLAKYQPRFEKADADKSIGDYETAMQAFIREFKDIHVGLDSAPYLFGQPNPLGDEYAGGIGMNIRKLDDGTVLVNYVLDGGPASEAGIEVKAQILEINGDIASRIANATPLNPPDVDYNHDDVIEGDRERAATRFPVGAIVDVTYRNPGDSEDKIAHLTAVAEDSSRLASRIALYGADPKTNLPLEYKELDSGYGYIKINSFDDDPAFTLLLWQHALQLFNQDEIHGIVLDLRHNGGGWDFNYLTMLGFLYATEQDLGGDLSYAADIDGFTPKPYYREMVTPADPDDQYKGQIVALVSPYCVSACEFFTDGLQRTGRATIVGQYHTAGGGGSIKYVYLPEDVQIQFTFSRAVTATGEGKIQATGVVPDIKVPLDEDTLFADDAILDAGVTELDTLTGVQPKDGGEIAVGQSKSGTLEPFTSENYTFTATEDVTLDLNLTDPDSSLDTVLTAYDATGNLLDTNDDNGTGSPNSEITALDVTAGETVMIEVKTYDPTDSGAYTLTVKAG